MPKHAESDADIERCFAVMAELRTHLRRETFVATVREMEKQGFRVAYLEEDGLVVSVAGYRISTNLFLGKNLYVEDLVVSDSARSKGHGARMIEWLRGEAISAGCAFFHLDSGTQRRRAHRFYFAQGMEIASFRFTQKL